MSPRFPSTALLLFFGTLLAATPACGEDASAPVLPVDQARLDPELRALVDEHARAIREQPGTALPHGELGRVYEANRLWGVAREAYEQAAELEPEEPRWAWLAALMLHREGDSSGALARLQTSAELGAGSAPFLFLLGTLLLETGAADGALRAFDEVLALDPGPPEGWAGRGEVRIALGDPELAARDLEQALARDPQYKSARYMLGVAYSRLGRGTEAQRALAEGAGALPRFLEDAFSRRRQEFEVGRVARLEAAQAELQRARPEAALELVAIVLEHHPRDPDAWAYRGMALAGQGQHAQALAALERAAELAPQVARTHVSLATLHLEMKDPGAALRAADRALAINAEAPAVQVTRGRALAALGKPGRARAAFGLALEQLATNRSALEALGQLDAAAGRQEAARQSFRALTRAHPTYAPGFLYLARSEHALGADDAARAALARASRLGLSGPPIERLASKLGTGLER